MLGPLVTKHRHAWSKEKVVPTLVPHKLTPEDAWRPTLTERD
jgi:hypothetical protein